MKNKKSIYFLLPVVLFIWGMVIYQFFSFSGNETVLNASASYSKTTIIKPEKQSFAIDVNYRDPFLGKMYNPQQTKKGHVSKEKNRPKEVISWPYIAYKGIVSDTKDNNKVFVVVINNSTFFMQEKDTEQGVTLKTGNKNYINVEYKGLKTKITIQE
ncbi:hypothetical protein KJK34_07195 [Flavobacterium sp. D11R37]|uniref:hypothetical protein n=1 Tax=Flavobacterium coralii TaxID=2838017 RepID=UPI001CA62E9A|nr:hypothetical protein [Flavobacterium coralii]MBY8962535.1 hypothetical protein [Flavobacterium coralii]